MKKINLILILLLTVPSLGCGFKLVNNKDLINFQIREITTEGDNYINYKIKRKIQLLTKNKSNNEISINLDSKKIKNIKEKNIKNKIQKYKITINVDVNYRDIVNNESNQFVLKKTGDFSERAQKTNSIIAERRLIDKLCKEITDEIIYQISLKFNDI